MKFERISDGNRASQVCGAVEIGLGGDGKDEAGA